MMILLWDILFIYIQIKHFVSEFYSDNMITKIDGIVVESKGHMLEL